MAGDLHHAGAGVAEGVLAVNALGAATGDGPRTLDAALLAAHAARDTGALVRLYAAAADAAAAQDRAEAAGFYLTHAYVYALEAGDPVADLLHARLRAAGRDD